MSAYVVWDAALFSRNGIRGVLEVVLIAPVIFVLRTIRALVVVTVSVIAIIVVARFSVAVVIVVWSVATNYSAYSD